MKRTDAQLADLKRAGARTDLNRAEVKRTDVKRTDVKRTDLKRTDVQLAYVQLAHVQLADVEGADEKGTHVIVPNYSRRPPGRGPLNLARLVRDGHRL
ncbi:MAG: hypothetical protein JF606_29915 [Burkholderiales bacterium]|nr:hypothetical protein [Burkholderiales bacterium]